MYFAGIWISSQPQQGRRFVVQVGVHCYIGLLSSMSEGDTSLLAEEIIRKADSVVPLLMSSKGDSAEDNARRILGLELLVHFIRAQSSSDVSSLLAERVQESYVSYIPAVI